jgi:hypothetical protein
VRWASGYAKAVKSKDQREAVAKDAVLLLAHQAKEGRGLAGSMKRHAKSDPILDLEKVVRWRLRGAVATERRRARNRSPGEDVVNPEDLDGVAVKLAWRGFASPIRVRLEMDRILDIEGDLRGQLSRPITETLLSELGHIFSRWAPREVTSHVEGLSRDSRLCIYLALFPLNLPVREVAGYLVSGGTTQPRMRADVTSRKIRVLRRRIEHAWPEARKPRQGERHPWGRAEKETIAGEEWRDDLG